MVSGIVAGIFSDLIHTDPNKEMVKLGMNNSLYGIVGLGAGYLFINWSALRRMGHIFKLKMFMTLFFALLFLIIYGNKVQYADTSGHLGGFLVGVFISGMMPSIIL